MWTRCSYPGHRLGQVGGSPGGGRRAAGQSRCSALRADRTCRKPFGKAFRKTKLDEEAIPQALFKNGRSDLYAGCCKSAEQRRNVAEANVPIRGQGPAQKQELTDLELKQKEQRYEEDKQASEEQTANGRRICAVLNRFGRTQAQRQEALAEKDEAAGAAGRRHQSEDEKEELANQLKRLQDEQIKLLRGSGRFERPHGEAGSRRSVGRGEAALEDTREKVAEAAEEAGGGRSTGLHGCNTCGRNSKAHDDFVSARRVDSARR